MADKIQQTDRVYIIRGIDDGSGSGGNTYVTNNYITEVVDPDIKSSDVTHDGTIGSGKTVKTILDELQYQPLTVSYFRVGGSSPMLREKGNTLTTIAFTWEYNTGVTSQSISGGITLLPTDRSKTLSGQSITTDRTWSLTGNDGTTIITQNVSVQFLNSLRWIAMTEQTITSSLLHTWNSALKASLSQEFTVTAGANDYIYFAAPQSMGTAKLWIGGFEEVFTQTSFTYVNQYGHSEAYYIYKSQNKGLGLTTVTATS